MGICKSGCVLAMACCFKARMRYGTPDEHPTACFVSRDTSRQLQPPLHDHTEDWYGLCENIKELWEKREGKRGRNVTLRDAVSKHNVCKDI